MRTKVIAGIIAVVYFFAVIYLTTQNVFTFGWDHFILGIVTTIILLFPSIFILDLFPSAVWWIICIGLNALFYYFVILAILPKNKNHNTKRKKKKAFNPFFPHRVNK